MKFKNKISNKVVEANGYAEEFAYSHNSNWELVEEKGVKTPTPQKPSGDDGKEKEPTVNEIKEKLTELNIDFKGISRKDELMALLEKAQKPSGDEKVEGSGEDGKV